MVTHLNSMGYDNNLYNAWEDYDYTEAFPEDCLLQRGNVPFYHGQCCKEDMVLEASSKVLLEVSCHH